MMNENQTYEENKKGMKTLTVRVNQQNKLEVAKGHFYSKTCQCADCLTHWLGVLCGDIVVMSFDGKHRMVPPGSKNGTKNPPCKHDFNDVSICRNCGVNVDDLPVGKSASGRLVFTA